MSLFIKRATSFAARSAAFEKFVSLLEYADGQRSGLLRVLTYHRVDDPQSRPWLDPVLISATPASFKEQMGYVAKYYTPVSVMDVIAAVQNGEIHRLPPRAVLVTFDDAYCDFMENAWPIMKRLGIPATLFVPTAYPDQPQRTFWWDDLYNALRTTARKDELYLPLGDVSLSADFNQTFLLLKPYLKSLKHVETLSTVRQLCEELGVAAKPNSILGWDSLRKLSNEGVALGAHTRTHPLMNRVSIEEARDEVIGSVDDLRREIGATLPVFAYPSGEFSMEVVNMLAGQGIVLAFTTTRGINNLRQASPLQIKRINVGGGTSLPILRAQLLSWMLHFHRLETFIRA